MNFQLSNGYFGMFLSSLVPILFNIEKMYILRQKHPIKWSFRWGVSGKGSYDPIEANDMSYMTIVPIKNFSSLSSSTITFF